MHNYNYTFSLLTWGPRELTLPMLHVARYLIRQNHTVRVIGSADAKADFDAWKVNYTVYDDPAMRETVANVRAATGLWSQARAGAPYDGEAGVRLGRTWLEFSRGADIIIGSALPWTQTYVTSIAEALEIPVALLVPYPGTVVAYEHILDPLHGTGALVDHGWQVNYALSHLRNLIAGFGQWSSVNSFRGAANLTSLWLANAMDYQTYRYVLTYFDWSPIFFNRPVEGFFRFTALFTDLALYDRQVLTVEEAPTHPVSFFNGSAPLRDDLVPFFEARNGTVAFVDLNHATEDEATAVRDAIVSQGLSAVVHPASTVPRGGWKAPAAGSSSSFLVLSSLEGVEIEALLDASTYAFHHGDSHYLGLAIKAGTASIVVPAWLRVWHGLIAQKLVGAVVAGPVTAESVAAAITAAKEPAVTAALAKYNKAMYSDWGISLLSRTLYDCIARMPTYGQREILKQHMMQKYGKTEQNIFEP